MPLDDCEANAKLAEKYLEESDASPMALMTEKANEQHYGYPPLYRLVKNLKYSCCFFKEERKPSRRRG